MIKRVELYSGLFKFSIVNKMICIFDNQCATTIYYHKLMANMMKKIEPFKSNTHRYIFNWCTNIGLATNHGKTNHTSN